MKRLTIVLASVFLFAAPPSHAGIVATGVYLHVEILSLQQHFRAMYQAQRDLARLIEVRDLDKLGCERNLILENTYGSLSQIPKYSLALRLLDWNVRVRWPALKELAQIEQVNEWELQALARSIRADVEERDVIHRLRHKQKLQLTEAVWSDIRLNLFASLDQARVTLEWLSSHPQFAQEIPSTLIEDLTNLPRYSVKELKSELRVVTDGLHQVDDKVFYLERDADDHQSHSQYRSNVRLHEIKPTQWDLRKRTFNLKTQLAYAEALEKFTALIAQNRNGSP